MLHAHTLTTLRNRFGLRQRDLAAWLELSLSQVSRIEAGLDPLPGHARGWLLPWYAALTAAAAAPEPFPMSEPAAPPRSTVAGPEALLARLAECRYQARRVAGRLAALRARAHSWRARLAAGPVLQAALDAVLPAPGNEPGPPTLSDAGGRRRRWLARFLEEATDELRPEAAHGDTTVTLLAARHSAWQHEADWLAARLAAG